MHEVKDKMEERKLKIVENKGYKNLDFKEKATVVLNGKEVKTEEFVLDDGFVFIQKSYVEGLEKVGSKAGKTWKFYICKGKYAGDEVSFILTEREHEAYKVLGGVDDTIKVTGKKNDKWLNLQFELVQ